jgi:hypothetical protein
MPLRSTGQRPLTNKYKRPQPPVSDHDHCIPWRLVWWSLLAGYAFVRYSIKSDPFDNPMLPSHTGTCAETMPSYNLLLAVIGTIVASFASVHALPTWESFNSRSSIDSLVTGSTSLLAGGLEYGQYYLMTPWPKGACVVDGPSPPFLAFASHTNGRAQARLET